VGRTPAGGGDLTEAQPLGLVAQLLTQVEVPGSFPFGRRSAALHDLTTYFIAWTANSYPAVHYNLTHRTSSATAQLLHSPPQDAAGGAPPAGVEQSHPSPWHHEVDRDAVGDSYGQEDPGRSSDPPIYPFDLDPPAPRIQAHHFDAMYLVAQRNGLELRQLTAERLPAAHHLANWCVTPEAEIEPATGLGAAAGDTGNDSVAFAPGWNLEPGNGSWDGGLANL